MKPILPSLKENNRYLVYEVIKEDNIRKEAILKALEANCNSFLGQFGMSRAKIKFLEFNDSRGIIKVNNKHVNNLRAALCLIEKIDDKKVIIKTKGVSGTIKKAKEKFGG